MKPLDLKPLLRCAAPLAVALGFAALYPMSSNPRMTYASDLGFIAKEDHNHPRILYHEAPVKSNEKLYFAQVDKGQSYGSNVAGLDHIIVGRAPGDGQDLGNNIPMKRNIEGGKTQYWVLRKETIFAAKPAETGTPLLFESAPRDSLNETVPSDVSVETEPHSLLRRQDGSQGSTAVYVSLAICDQPSWKDQSLSKVDPRSLTLYISQSPENQEPREGKSDHSFSTSEGFGATRIQASGDIFFGVTAAKNSNLDGIYNYELSVSVDTLYAAYNGHENLPNAGSEDYIVHLDSDSNSALFVSSDFTKEKPTASVSPYSIFVHSNDDPSILGIQRSFCGLRNHVQIKGNLLNDPSTSNVDTRLIELGQDKSKQEFYVTGLNASSEYFAVLAVDGNSTSEGGGVVRGGGTVGRSLSFRTKSDRSCAILHNLSFCTDVAYAVPFNPANSDLSNLTKLATLYDDNARNLYRNFSFARQQIPCDTTPAAQYSLARNCTHCDNAYKSWLCAVTIPRCEDFSSSNNWLQARAVKQPFHNGTLPSSASDPALNAANKSIIHMKSSRSQLIDDFIHPEPWKEILPCKDLCYELVQSCPASMGFACPLEGHGEESYGSRHNSRNITCNYPNNPWYFSKAASTAANEFVVFAVICVVLLLHLGG